VEFDLYRKRLIESLNMIGPAALLDLARPEKGYSAKQIGASPI